MEHKTLTFDEKVTGWTSFHSFSPDAMIGMNNRFFSFSGGNLHIHHSDTTDRNTYYGVENTSRVSLMVNDEPSTVKEVKAISQEGNYPWNTQLSAYVSNEDNPIQSTIRNTEYVKKEGFWYSHARRNESNTHFDSRSSYGLGVVTSLVGNTLNYNGFSSSICAGDKIYRGNDATEVGTIVSYTDGVIVLGNVVGTLTAGDFILGYKDPRTEGGNLRGYTLRLDLEISNTEKVELFAVNSEVIKSYS